MGEMGVMRVMGAPDGRRNKIKALLQNPWLWQGEIPLVAFEGQEDGQG
jgi:hypothetical protein